MINERANLPCASSAPSTRLGCLVDRLTSLALRGLISVLVVFVTAPLWLVWTAVLILLGIARPLIVYPLGFAAFGALFAGVWFGATGAWGDALQAALLALTAGAGLAAYGVFFDRFKLDNLREASPPWWWYL